MNGESLDLDRDSSGVRERWEERLRLARSGCRESQAMVLEAAKPLLQRLATMQGEGDLGVRQGVSDVVQETMTAAWLGITGFRGETRAEVVAWLKTILGNKVRSAHRFHSAAIRDHRREEPLLSEVRGHVDRASRTKTPSSGARSKELRANLERAMQRLSQSDEQVIRLRNQTELTFEEIAQVMGTSAEAARKRWARAVSRLGDYLREFCDE